MEESQALLRIYTDEEARKGDHLVYETIVTRARDAGLAGATALKGMLGFGLSAHVHSGNPFRLAGDLPVVIEIVDEVGRLRDFASELADLHDVGLVTLERVEVVHSRPRP